ncbi:NAD(P)H nitroreductase [Blastococcus sp. TF02A-26]|uniref:Acg family FMN-binding oxidoreductase n=1 Tax=Blastococcus sp. TF02A-26 TaxID=2250577 RepID=UPI000DE8F383|nr:NAD(P)H nitroreductase [Blastococcus sp. TF02A-26]RBY80755.1 NAD(P)H nitroreductase [Blastococcus sp. TF02A-26]
MLTTHLDRSTARAAVALANRAPSVHNSQPWRWRIGPSSIHLFADPARALPATDPEGRGLLISCGAALHHLRVALRATGSAGRIHRLPDPAHPQHLAAVELSPAPPTAEDLALAQAIEHRRSDRRVFSTWPVPDEFTADLARAAADEGATLVVLDPARQWEVARLVERAAVEQALTPGLAQEVALWSGRARGSADGVPAANVPGDATAAVPVRHFAGREMAQNELGRGESDGTLLAVLATDGDGTVDRLRAGEALSAVLLAATAIGLATDPISQPLEVAATRARLAADCLPSGRAPQVLLRLGWAPVSAEPVPATGRRPVDETIDAFDASW